MTDLKEINYLPLSDSAHSWAHVWKTSFHGKSGGVLLLILVLGFGLSAGLKSGLLFDITIAAIVVFLGYLIVQVSAYKSQLWIQFAIVNGWMIDTNTPLSVLLAPSLMFGYDPQFSPVIQVQISDLAFDLYTYNCTVGEGKSSTTYSFTVAMTSLPKAMPHMLLRAKKSLAHEQDDMTKTIRLKLEGDFNDYFTLNIEKGQEIDALTVITPDVMQALVSYGQAEDVEILGNNLYFMVSGDTRSNVPKIEQLVLSVAELSSQLKENARLSTGSLLASTPAPAPVAAPTSPPVSA